MPPDTVEGSAAGASPSGPPPARRLSRLSAVVLWSVPLSGLIPYLLARTSMSPAVAALVGWHMLGGAAVSIPFLLTLRRWRSSIMPDARALGSVSAVVAIVTGAALIVWAALGSSVGRVQALLLAHAVAGIVCVVVVAVTTLARRLRSGTVPDGQRTALSITAAASLILLSITGLGAYTYDGEAYFQMLTATSAADSGNPRFPAGTLIADTSDWRRASGPESCGRAGCHPDVVRSWRASPHARAASGPEYRAALGYAISRIGADGARWCGGCHSPLADQAAREPAVGCLSCHAMRQVPAPIGNGCALFAAPAWYPFETARTGAARVLHDFLLRVRPAPHQAGLAGPADTPTGAAVCAPCHRLSVNAAQNHYKFVPYDTTWADWQAGPFSGESVHGFGPHAPRRTCVDCHFAADRGRDITGHVHDHSCSDYTGAAVPGRPGQRQGESGLSVEVFAIRRVGAEPGSAERIDAPLRNHPVVLRPGETVRADVLVQNVGIGHAFPSGVPDLRDVWLEFSVESSDGSIVLRSVGENVHRYGLASLDRSGRALSRGNVFDMIGQAYRFAGANGSGRISGYRALLPGIGDVARYRFQVPAGQSRTLTLAARLLYRPYTQAFSSWISRVAGGSDDVPTRARPPVVLAEDREMVGVQDSGRRVALPTVAGAGMARDDPRNAPRLAAYGAALLAQNDVPRARRAFDEAASLAPHSADAWIGLGRAYLQENDLLTAQARLKRALQVEPGDPRASVWIGRVYRLMGRYDLALKILEPLALRFPRDAETWLDIGLCRYLGGHPDRAIPAFRHMLDVDPDDPVAHLNLMQCYRRLLRISDARREEVIYRALQDTDPPESLVSTYLRSHPEERLESQPIHEHVLESAR